MKNFFSALFLLVSLSAFAQDKLVPVIKQGSKLTYVVHANGQDLDFFVSIDSASADYLKLGWEISGLGSGGWIMKRNSLAKATNAFWDEPAAGLDTELPDDQTVLTLSKLQWDAIQKEKKTIFDGQPYVVKAPSEQQLLKLGGKTLDAIILQSESGSTRFWILNNPLFPLVLKIEGNPRNVDLDLQSIN
jgi:hypothetical protein